MESPKNASIPVPGLLWNSIPIPNVFSSMFSPPLVIPVENMRLSTTVQIGSVIAVPLAILIIAVWLAALVTSHSRPDSFRVKLTSKQQYSILALSAVVVISRGWENFLSLVAWIGDENALDGLEFTVMASLLHLAFWAIFALFSTLEPETWLLGGAFSAAALCVEAVEWMVGGEPYSSSPYPDLYRTLQYARFLSSAIITSIFVDGALRGEPPTDLGTKNEKASEKSDRDASATPSSPSLAPPDKSASPADTDLDTTMEKVMYDFDAELAREQAREADEKKEKKEKEEKEEKEKKTTFGIDFSLYSKQRKLMRSIFWPKDANYRLTYGLYIIYLIVCRYLTYLTPTTYSDIINQTPKIQNRDQLYGVIRSVILWTVIKALNNSSGTYFLKRMFRDHIRHIQAMNIEAHLMRHVLSMSADFRATEKPGDINQIIMTSRMIFGAVEDLLFNLLPVLCDLFLSFYICCQMAGFEAGFALALSISVYLATSLYERRVLKPLHKAAAAMTARLSLIRREVLDHWDIVSMFQKQDFEVARYSHASAAAHKAEKRTNRGEFDTDVCQELFAATTRAVFAIIHLVRVSRGQSGVGEFIALMVNWRGFFYDATQALWVIRGFTSNFHKVERLLELLERQPSVRNSKDAKPMTITGNVEFRNVSFRYGEGPGGVSDVSFSIKAGQSVAFVGKTGAGKSTIARLWARQYDPSEGDIFIDGVNIKDIDLDSLRQQIGTVPQQGTLFPRTILSNVLYGNPKATMAQVYEVCRMANIHDYIMSLPKQYHSEVGERGVKLSGGEIQRLTIARMLLVNAPLVILDEASSAVDTETERHIQLALENCKNRTTLIIAHRLSTIRKADLIVVMDGGKVIEQGSFSELYAKQGKFRELWELQTFVESADTSEDGETSDNTEVSNGSLDEKAGDGDDDADTTKSNETEPEGTTEPAEQACSTASGTKSSP